MPPLLLTRVHPKFDGSPGRAAGESELPRQDTDNDDQNRWQDCRLRSRQERNQGTNGNVVQPFKPYAHSKGLKGCTTFRFNPEAFQGVLVKEADLENTTYKFTLDNGDVVELKGNEEIEYDGEIHTAANLFDALKEGYYGKF